MCPYWFDVGEAGALAVDGSHMAAVGEAGALGAGGCMVIRKQAVAIRLLTNRPASTYYISRRVLACRVCAEM